MWPTAAVTNRWLDEHLPGDLDMNQVFKGLTNQQGNRAAEASIES